MTARALERHHRHYRLIAAVLIVLVLSLQFVNLLSNSHTRVVHRHAPGKSVATLAHGERMQAQVAVNGKSAHSHSHQHDPGDHSHDLPLRQVLAVVQFSFLPVWHIEVAAPIRSALVRPLERPPKSCGNAAYA